MIPLKDDNPTQHFPIVTVAFIVINVLVHFVQLPLSREELEPFFRDYGFVPARFFTDSGPSGALPPWMTIFSSMFMHGSLFHLGGNMLYLWIFGNNIEDIMGPIRFIIFYLICGVGAAMLQGILNPDSMIPMVGASGAVSGILGGYMLMFPRARITMLIFIFFFIQIIKVPASVVLGIWIFFQLLSGFNSLSGEGGGVAFFAHIGGFVFGLALIKIFRSRRRVTAKVSGKWSPFSG